MSFVWVLRIMRARSLRAPAKQHYLEEARYPILMARVCPSGRCLRPAETMIRAVNFHS